MADPFLAVERDFYRALNGLVEPLARSGLLSPGPLNAGLILLEVKGRRTGIVHPVPLVATLIGPLVLVATLRGGRSQWLRNLEEEPHVRYWLRGAAHDGLATVLRRGNVADSAESDPLTSAILSLLRAATESGWSFAVLRAATR